MFNQKLGVDFEFRKTAPPISKLLFYKIFISELSKIHSQYHRSLFDYLTQNYLQFDTFGLQTLI